MTAPITTSSQSSKLSDPISKLHCSRSNLETRIRDLQKDLIRQSRASRHYVGQDQESWQPGANRFDQTLKLKKQLIVQKEELTKQIESKVDYAYCVMDSKEDCGIENSASFKIQAKKVEGCLLTLRFIGAEAEAKPRLYLFGVKDRKIQAQLAFVSNSSKRVEQEAKIQIEDYISIGKDLEWDVFFLEIRDEKKVHSIQLNCPK